jgi:hypothetical protein
MRRGLMAASALALVCSGPAGATDILMPGVITIVKDTKLFKVVAKPTSGSFTIPAPGSGGDPQIGGGDLSVFDTNGAGTLTDGLTGGVWSGLGNPPGISGYKYKNTLAPAGGAAKIILVKGAVVKVIAKDDGTLNGPVSGNVGIILSIGTTPDRLCAEFGGSTVKNETGLVKRKTAPAPGACPTVAPSGCAGCNGDGFINFTTTNSPGDCGDIINAAGTLITNIACAGLYTGGGGNSVPLPYAVPDLSSAVTKISTCTGSVATVGAATSSETGSNNNCTATGCRFGAPLAVPNPGSTPTSVCVINALSSGASGTVNCSTGAQSISAPLSSVIFLTGDTGDRPRGYHRRYPALPALHRRQLHRRPEQRHALHRRHLDPRRQPGVSDQQRLPAEQLLQHRYAAGELQPLERRRLVDGHAGDERHRQHGRRPEPRLLRLLP